MPFALPILVACPKDKKNVFLEDCKNCVHFAGIMEDRMLNCELIEETGVYNGQN